MGGQTGKKKFWVFGAFFVSGLVVGVVGMCILAAASLGTHRELLRLEFATHHEFLAVRAAREGRDLDELGHRWVVAEARRTDGWWGVEPLPLSRRMAFPVVAPVLESARESADVAGHGRRVVEGFAWARLAESMESLGYDDEARTAWSRATSLVAQDEESLRATVASTKDFESSEIHASAERAVLQR